LATSPEKVARFSPKVISQIAFCRAAIPNTLQGLIPRLEVEMRKASRFLRGRILYGKRRKDGQLDGRSRATVGLIARGPGGHGREVMRTRPFATRKLAAGEIRRLCPLYMTGGRFDRWIATP